MSSILSYVITLLVVYIILYFIIHDNLYNTSQIDTDKEYTNQHISLNKVNKQKHDSDTHNDKKINTTLISTPNLQSSKPYKMRSNSTTINTITNRSPIKASDSLVVPVSLSKLTTPLPTPLTLPNKLPLSLPKSTNPYIHNKMIFSDNKYYANNTCIYTHFEPVHQALIPPITPDPIYQIDAIYVVHYTPLKKRKQHMIKHIYDIFGMYPTFIEAFDKQVLTDSSNSSGSSGKSIRECFIEPGRDMQMKLLDNTTTYIG